MVSYRSLRRRARRLIQITTERSSLMDKVENGFKLTPSLKADTTLLFGSVQNAFFPPQHPQSLHRYNEDVQRLLRHIGENLDDHEAIRR